MRFKVTFLLSLKWFETRLTFNNLKLSESKLNDVAHGNNVGHSDAVHIWMPRVFFASSLEEVPVRHDVLSSIEILREGKAQTNSPYDLYSNQLFEGAENPFVFKRVYTLDIACDFKLQWYPMDYQDCYINVSL